MEKEKSKMAEISTTMKKNTKKNMKMTEKNV